MCGASVLCRLLCQVMLRTGQYAAWLYNHQVAKAV